MSHKEYSKAEFREAIYRSYADTHTTYSDEAASGSVGRFVTLERFFSVHLPPDRASRILDFGCGDGFTLKVVQQLGYENLEGVDLSQQLLAKASGRTSATLHHGDGTGFLKACPDGRYDVIIAFDVFEHLDKPELLAVCSEISRTLRDGGRLLLHVPNGASPYSGKILWGDITHELAFTSHSLGQLLKPLGFADVQVIEDKPIPHGIFSMIRAILWKIVRFALIFRMAIETGQLDGNVFTINMFAVALYKPLKNREFLKGP